MEKLLQQKMYLQSWNQTQVFEELGARLVAVALNGAELATVEAVVVILELTKFDPKFKKYSKKHAHTWSRHIFTTCSCTWIIRKLSFVSHLLLRWSDWFIKQHLWLK